jgi:hypothetical protein
LGERNSGTRWTYRWVWCSCFRDSLVYSARARINVFLSLSQPFGYLFQSFTCCKFLLACFVMNYAVIATHIAMLLPSNKNTGDSLLDSIQALVSVSKCH